jgi:Lar family restriction alleviation protein
MNETVLKPCPFCGKEVQLYVSLSYPNGSRIPAKIWCMTCDFKMTAYDEERVLARWNSRPMEDALRGENAVLQEFRDFVEDCGFTLHQETVRDDTRTYLKGHGSLFGVDPYRYRAKPS